MATSSFLLEARRLLRMAKRVALGLREDPVEVFRKTRSRIAGSKSRPPDAFDENHQVDTAGEIDLFRLDITSQNESVGVRYQPSPANACHELLASLPIRYEDFTFIDLGAGKGRVLLVASRFAFKRQIGVEFAADLVKTARQNIERFGCRAEVVHADASDYRFPSDNLVVYLYNPFGPEVLRPVLSSLQAISASYDVYLVYLNPRNKSYVDEFAREISDHHGAKVYKFP